MIQNLQIVGSEDSIAPIYLDPTPQIPANSEPWEQIQSQITTRQAAIIKLMALGLTEEEALALAGT